MCEYSRSRSFYDDLILHDQATGERYQDQWSSVFFCFFFSFLFFFFFFVVVVFFFNSVLRPFQDYFSS